MACFWDCSRRPAKNDALQIDMRTGTITSLTCFNSHVGTGSSGQCFDGAVDSNLEASSGVSSSSLDNAVVRRLLITGAEALAACQYMHRRCRIVILSTGQTEYYRTEHSSMHGQRILLVKSHDLRFQIVPTLAISIQNRLTAEWQTIVDPIQLQNPNLYIFFTSTISVTQLIVLVLWSVTQWPITAKCWWFLP